ncbi:hypothetical protein ACMFMG_003396 [Clarireedia jacksonii]
MPALQKHRRLHQLLRQEHQLPKEEQLRRLLEKDLSLRRRSRCDDCDDASIPANGTQRSDANAQGESEAMIDRWIDRGPSKQKAEEYQAALVSWRLGNSRAGIERYGI